MRQSIKVKKGDMVTVISGNEKGKRGKVIKIIPQKDRVLVEKINIIKRHTRAGDISRQGGIIEKEAPIHIAKVQVVCPKCDKQSRIRMEKLDDGKKVRACKKCGEFLDKT